MSAVLNCKLPQRRSRAKRTGARMTEKFIDKPRTAPVENVALIACDAPFVAKRAYLPAYRQSPLIVQEDKCSKSPLRGRHARHASRRWTR